MSEINVRKSSEPKKRKQSDTSPNEMIQHFVLDARNKNGMQTKEEDKEDSLLARLSEIAERSTVHGVIYCI